MFKNLQVAVVYIITHLGLIFFVYPTDIIASTQEAHWAPILAGYIIHVIIVFVYLKGLSYYGNLNILQILINKSKVIAWMTLFPVFLYLSLVIVITIRAYAEIISIVILADTPIWILMCVLLGIPVFMIMHGGIKALLRAGILLGILFLPPMLFVMFSAFQNVDMYYALPLIPKDPTKIFSFLTRLSYYKSLFAFAGGFLFLGFIPSALTFKPKTIYISSVVVLLFFLVSVYIPILTLGEETARQLVFPFIFTIDTIEINWLMFDRITIFFLLSLIAFVMLFIAITLWQIASLIRTKVQQIPNPYLLPAIAIVVLLICLCIPEWEDVEKLLQWNSFLRLYVSLVIPTIVFILGYRHHRRVRES
ncbi:GerAB/ArcD/ProY family transporter [Paenibacillus qinlingensis]|uniref:GerAB/ArcD/ProY family transporter n=1 Tax=Paenibacillus qinlingensis TaxID=1837343 RepID=UPI001564761F|nr:GerAB/ArcD/ProY family transporter [Paenibacillus qinlingensis]NQX59148.1 GerAB/ArcD/ProY family transporter [Paenibacillus qinlingensis]